VVVVEVLQAGSTRILGVMNAVPPATATPASTPRRSVKLDPMGTRRAQQRKRW
jgi:hypothetical protein